MRAEAEQSRAEGQRVMSEIAAEIEGLRARAASLELESSKRVKAEAQRVSRLDRGAQLFAQAAEIEKQLVVARDTSRTADAALADALSVQMTAERRHNDLRAVAIMATSVGDDADAAAEVDALARRRAAEELVAKAAEKAEQARRATVTAKDAARAAAGHVEALDGDLADLVERAEALARGEEDPAEVRAREAEVARQRADTERRRQIAAQESRDRARMMTDDSMADLRRRAQADQLRRQGWVIPGITRSGGNQP